MREIKFRGKAMQDFDTHIEGVEVGDWVYGYYYFDRGNFKEIIITDLQEESGGVEGCSGMVQAHVWVDPKTIGQYIGKKDRDGQEIYEHDHIVGRYGEAIVIYTDTGFYPFAGDINVPDPEKSKIVGNFFDGVDEDLKKKELEIQKWS